MLNSIIKACKGHKRGITPALIAAIGLVSASVSAPGFAQELETFDPDAAFENVARDSASDAARSAVDTAQSAFDQGEADVGAVSVAIPDQAAIDQGFRTAPSLDPVTGMPAPARSVAPGDGPTGNGVAGPGFTDEFANLDQSDPGARNWSEQNWDGRNWAQGDETAMGVSPTGEPATGESGPDWATPYQGEAVANAASDTRTYGQDDLIGAAEGVFGKGAKGLAGMIEDLLRKQGEPNGYIVGREAGGAFIFGARYGSGTLYHKVEGERKVYWTGPSLGFDAGANAGNTFVLVYNLFDTEDIFKRYPAGEGQAYLIGGLHASYMRRGDVVLIPIRMGAGLRLGVNAGYMRFSKKHRWLPF